MGHSQSNNHYLKQLQLPEAEHYVLAFSGGSDSTALLHALSQMPAVRSRLSALHINHQVQKKSGQWTEHCQRFCQQLSVPLTVQNIKTQKTDENSLRQARLRAYAAHLDGFDTPVILLTGHHLNDNVETMLFRLLRGSGLKGLTGMSPKGQIQKHPLFRPLLQTPKSEIQQYLLAHQLDWIDDPSNANDNYDRNFIRNQVIPLLLSYRPDAIDQMAQSRDNLEASLNLLHNYMGDHNPLTLDKKMDQELLTSSLYHWLNQKNLAPVHRRQLHSFIGSCMTATADKQPQLATDDYILTGHGDEIYALRPHVLSLEIPEPMTLQVSKLPFHWQHDFGQLQLTSSCSSSVDATLTLAFNQTGKKILLPGHDHHKRVKEVLRVAGIPTWQRPRLPYLYADKELLAVGQFISVAGQAWLDQHQLQYSWHSCHYLL